QRRLVRLGAAGREERAREVARGERGEPRGEADGRGHRRRVHAHADVAELLGHGGDDLLAAVADIPKVHAADRVHVLVTREIPEADALRRDRDGRPALRLELGGVRHADAEMLARRAGVRRGPPGRARGRAAAWASRRLRYRPAVPTSNGTARRIVAAEQKNQ